MMIRITMNRAFKLVPFGSVPTRPAPTHPRWTIEPMPPPDAQGGALRFQAGAELGRMACAGLAPN